MKAPRILSVSYDQSLLITRQGMLQQRGYTVISAYGFQQALEECSGGGFDLFILGHSIPGRDKMALVNTFRANCSAPIVSLRRSGEEPVDGADYHLDPEPQELLAKVSELLDHRMAS